MHIGNLRFKILLLDSCQFYITTTYVYQLVHQNPLHIQSTDVLKGFPLKFCVCAYVVTNITGN